MTITPNRVPPGSPDGGEFANRPGSAESDIDLCDTEPTSTDERTGSHATNTESIYANAHHDEAWIRRSAAANKHCPPVLLTMLAADPNDKVRMEVAHNPTAPTQVLDVLANDPSTSVRRRTAGNLNLSEASAVSLAADRSYEVRLRIAANPNLPIADVARLKADTDPAVSSIAATHHANRTY